MNLPLSVGERRKVTVHITGHDGPGTSCGPHTSVEIAVQVAKEWIGAMPGDVATFTHSVDIEVVGHEDGLRWRGPAVHGPTHERFLYLVWTGVIGSQREMFRRAKLKLATVPTDVLTRALGTGTLRAGLSLRMPDGTPVCATPRSLVWTA
jgi:hypothetical protein